MTKFININDLRQLFFIADLLQLGIKQGFNIFWWLAYYNLDFRNSTVVKIQTKISKTSK